MEYLNINSFETKHSVTIDSLKTHFLPIQEGEGDPSPDNVRPITGWNSIKVRKCGKNLAKVVGYSATSPNNASSTRRISNSYGTILSTTDYSDELSITQTQYPEPSNLKLYSNGYFCIVLDGLLYDKKYNVSFKISNVVSNPLNATLSDITIANPYGTYTAISNVIEDGRLTYKNMNYKRHSANPNRCSISIYNCGMSFTLSEFMITAVENEDFTYEPYREEEVEVELPKTVYGGYVDIAKGELVETCKLISFGGTSAWSDGGVYTGHMFSRGVDSNVSNARSNTDIIVCNYLKPAPNGQSANVAVYGNNIITTSTTMKGVYVNVDFVDTVDEWKEYLAEHPLIFIYNLETPIHYPLPPETLKTLRGFNTIFSTGNDTIEVGYSELSPMSLLELRRNIIASEPHLVTVETGNTEDSDVIASFKTNATLPIKSMVTNFEPKQEGEGDPSPENIRPITGLSELEIHNFPHLVQWNQWLQPISEENWIQYNANNISVAFSDGVVTSEWLVDSSGGYATAVRNKAIIPNPEGHIWYVSYMVRYHAQDIKHFGVEFAGGRQIRAIVAAEPDIWYQVSTVGSWYKNNNAYVYISNVSNGEGEVGLVVESKSPVYIDLTRMYGAGNEPTKEEFEAQCALNGIDLTTYNPYDEGTVIPWRTSDDEDKSVKIEFDDYLSHLTHGTDLSSYNDYWYTISGKAYRYCDLFDGVPLPVSFIITDKDPALDISSSKVSFGVVYNSTNVEEGYNWIIENGKINGRNTNGIHYPSAKWGIPCKYLFCYPKDVSTLQTIFQKYDITMVVEPLCNGYVDVTNGELVLTHKLLKLIGYEKWDMSTSTLTDAPYRPNFMLPDASRAVSYYAPISNKLKGCTDWQPHLHNVVLNSNMRVLIGVSGDLNTSDKVNEWIRSIGGIDVVYPLATPLHFPLSPTVIRTLKGMNNIYTNANGKTIIKYWTH